MNEAGKDTGKITQEKPFFGDYSPVVKQIKELPRKTTEERGVVKKKIAEVREGISREKALLAHTRSILEHEVTQKPQINKEELLQDININQFPQEVQKAIRGSLDSHTYDRREIQETMSMLKKKAIREGATDQNNGEGPDTAHKIGEILYKKTVHGKPTGECIVRESPFGIWLSVTDEKDFDAFEVKDAAGFYRSSQTITERGRGYIFPLIVTKTWTRTGTVIHEEGHGENAQVSAGLWTVGEKFHRKFYGRSAGNYTFFLPRAGCWLAEIAEKTGILRSQAKELRRKALIRFEAETADLIEGCQSRAKNELLAELYNPQGNLDGHLYYLKVQRKTAEKETGKTAQKQSGSEEDEKEKKRIEETAPYDYLTYLGLEQLRNHPLFGPKVKEIRKEYNRSLDRAAEPLIELTNLWKQVGVDPEKMRRRFLYGELAVTKLSNWGGFIRREYGQETKVLGDLNRAQREIRARCFEVGQHVEEYNALDLAEAAQNASIERDSLNVDLQKPIETVLKQVKENDGEIHFSVLENAIMETKAILEEHKRNLEELAAERQVLETEILSKTDDTIKVKAAEGLNKDNAYLRETSSRMEDLWREQLALSDHLSEKLGVPIFEGVRKLEDTEEIPARITTTVGEYWNKQDKTFDFSSPEIQQAVRDIRDLRASLNLVGNLTAVNQELRRKMDTLADQFREEIRFANYLSPFRRYQSLSAPLDTKTAQQLVEVKAELETIQQTCAEEFGKAEEIFARRKQANKGFAA